MKRSLAVLRFLLVGVLCAGAEVHAQTVEIAPFVGWGFGGSLVSPILDQDRPIDSGITYGGAADIAIAPTWRFEAFYSRQESHVDGPDHGSRLGLTVERYMAGAQEEHAAGRIRVFGTFLAGVTRVVPSGFDSETRFSVGIGLGVKTYLARHVGLRLEAHGFYTPVTISGATVCAAGRCVFAFSGSGLFQGDVSGGVLFAF